MKSVFKWILISVLLCPFNFNLCCADQGKKPSELQAVEFLAGYGRIKLVGRQGKYNFAPFCLDFDLDLKPFIQKLGINYFGLQQFVIEPFFSYVSTPHDNAEIGNDFALKLGFVPITWRFQPYFKGGIGIIYLTQHLREQGTQFNFTEFAGFGLHYFFTKNTALTAEYRFRHVSNADIASPNHGISGEIGLAGISYFF